MRLRQPSGKQKTTCSKCHRELEANRHEKQRYCKECHAAHMRLTRPAYKDLPEEEKIKIRARSLVRVHVSRGKMNKQPCLFCGDPNSEAHHQDYSKPLDVTWLCKDHHKAVHNIKTI
jgi:hypothetical protein